MSGLETRPAFDSTSAAGAMRTRHAREPVLIGRMFAGPGTSTAHALLLDLVLHCRRLMEQTTAGTTLAASEPAGAAIGELRRLSGLTWEQLARLFNVSRRSLHFGRAERR